MAALSAGNEAFPTAALKASMKTGRVATTAARMVRSSARGRDRRYWIVATAVLPFVIGWALGHAGYAAAVFAALGISSLLLSLHSGLAGVMQGLGVSFLLSSAPAYFGGRATAGGYGPRWLTRWAA
jgi:hypothetical protein